ncbi:MAG TPA: TauD/TfdA family dioxygenase [Pyrinomonadaceae bacterium]|jgi:alpha-ketoglutarate-dependent taurine dioxygenase|nr:TauD/TfdA family dioxygenase [Pyrinomonadaceae bacterium]
MSTYQFARTALEHHALQQVTLSYLRPGSPLPLIVRPAEEELDLVEWAAANSNFIELYLLRNGAILFRDFDISTVEEFEQLIEGVSGPLLDYSYRSTPRHVVSGRIYSSTEYPAHQSIPLHNENSYTRNWPMKLSFFAQQVADKGGETPIADCRKIYHAISPEIRECFERKGLIYVRNYGTGLDLTWQEVFQTSSTMVVEDYCRRSGMEFEWVGADQLRTRQKARVVETHPRTGELVWFNQAHLFHASRLSAEVRDWLLAAYGEQNLPRNVYFADGSPIDPAMLDEITQVYSNHSVVFPWREGDVLMLDNMLTAHGRQPFVGQRKVVVGIAESIRSVADSASHIR